MSTQLNNSKILSEKEQAQFLRIIDGIKDTHRRDFLILKLLLKTGARCSEILEISLTDLNKENKSVFISGLKGSNSREIPLEPRFFNELYSYAFENTSTGTIFDIGYHRLRDLWAFYRPCPKKIHSLRHGFALRLYKKTKDIHLVKTALGHVSLNSTLGYMTFSYNQSELRKALL